MKVQISVGSGGAGRDTFLPPDRILFLFIHIHNLNHNIATAQYLQFIKISFSIKTSHWQTKGWSCSLLSGPNRLNLWGLIQSTLKSIKIFLIVSMGSGSGPQHAEHLLRTGALFANQTTPIDSTIPRRILQYASLPGYRLWDFAAVGFLLTS